MYTNTKNIILLLSLLFYTSLSIPSLPVSPSQYIIKGEFYLPYINLSIPVTVIYDSVNNRQYYDYYQGLDVQINLWNLNQSFTIGPEVYHIGCEINEGSGSLTPILPVGEGTSNWQFNGTTLVNDVEVNSFSMQLELYGKMNYYTISYSTKDNSLVQYYINGENTILFTSHPDHYFLNVDYFSTDISPYESYFTVPSFLTCTASQDSWSGDSNEDETNSENKQKYDPHHIVHHIKKNSENRYQQSFEHFQIKHSKEYVDQQEYHHRYNNFKQRLHSILRHNNFKKSSYTLAMNHFGDLTEDELKSFTNPIKHNGVLKNKFDDTYPGAGYHIPSFGVSDLPSSFDWREKGCVTPIKDQAICGSCWAFGSIASLEGQQCSVNGQLIELSEQQFIDCAYQQGSQGCDGGSAYGAFQYVMENGGISTESDYPYKAADNYCPLNRRSSGVQVLGYNRIQNGSESDLMDAVATVGPIAAAIDTHLGIDPDFYFYQSGVYSSTVCNSWNYDHEIAVIGYGNYQGQDYWLIKNSWSTHWGISGFGMMARNLDNSCAIATDAVYPIVKPQN